MHAYSHSGGRRRVIIIRIIIIIGVAIGVGVAAVVIIIVMGNRKHRRQRPQLCPAKACRPLVQSSSSTFFASTTFKNFSFEWNKTNPFVDYLFSLKKFKREDKKVA